MENVLNGINGICIALAENEKKTNKTILDTVLVAITDELKKDNLFKRIFQRIFYGGSYYDGLKVGNPNEFDIDLVLVLPKTARVTVKPSDKPAFVHVEISELVELGEDFKTLHNLVDIVTKKVSAKKTLAWMEGLLSKALNRLCPNGQPLPVSPKGMEDYQIYIKQYKSGPAFNLNVLVKSNLDAIELDVDLVPCFQFEKNDWPPKGAGYVQHDCIKHGGGTFLAVPKMPARVHPPDLYWRLSFQEQERKIIEGSDHNRLKPALRLIKKLRDRWQHTKIASYYIKTIFLWEVEVREKSFWNKPLAVVFREMLQVYHDKLKSQTIEYYWNKKYNVLCDIEKATLEGIANKIKRIIREIDTYADSDPFVVAKNLASEEELDRLRSKIDAGKKTPPQDTVPEEEHENSRTEVDVGYNNLMEFCSLPEEKVCNNVTPKIFRDINKPPNSKSQNTEGITLDMYDNLLEEIRRLTDRVITLEREVAQLRIENCALKKIKTYNC